VRNTDERAAAVKQRAKEIARQKQNRRCSIVMASYASACLLFIVGLSFAMPGIMAGMSDGAYTYAGAAASIFDGSGGFGYVFIGILAFLLGVSVTILCYRVRLRNRKDHGDAEDSDG
jgi:uncharacterized membrane protein